MESFALGVGGMSSHHKPPPTPQSGRQLPGSRYHLLRFSLPAVMLIIMNWSFLTFLLPSFSVCPELPSPSFLHRMNLVIEEPSRVARSLNDV